MLLKTHLLMSQTSIWITLKPVGRWIIKSTSVSNMMTLIHSYMSLFGLPLIGLTWRMCGCSNPHSFDTCKLLYNLTTCKWKQSHTTLTAHAYKLRECSWERGWKFKISWHPIRLYSFFRNHHISQVLTRIYVSCVVSESLWNNLQDAEDFHCRLIQSACARIVEYRCSWVRTREMST